MQHRSIAQRLERAKSIEARRELLTDWTENWRRDQRDVLDLLNAGIEAMDVELLTSAAGQLRAVTDKRFQALDRVFVRLLGEDA